MVYPALLPLMRTPRLPAVDWTDSPADLNGLVRFAERPKPVSARVPSHFKRAVPHAYNWSLWIIPGYTMYLMWASFISGARYWLCRIRGLSQSLHTNSGTLSSTCKPPHSSPNERLCVMGSRFVYGRSRLQISASTPSVMIFFPRYFIRLSQINALTYVH